MTRFERRLAGLFIAAVLGLVGASWYAVWQLGADRTASAQQASKTLDALKAQNLNDVSLREGAQSRINSLTGAIDSLHGEVDQLLSATTDAQRQSVANRYATTTTTTTSTTTPQRRRSPAPSPTTTTTRPPPPTTTTTRPGRRPCTSLPAVEVCP